MESIKKLGVLGGMGPEATALFYQWLTDRTYATCDQEHIPTLIFSDVTIPDRTAAIRAGTGDVVYARLLDDARLLKQCGCAMLAIPCNASHYFADKLSADAGIPVVHMIRETAARLKARGVHRAGILAAGSTIETGLYQTACAAAGVEAVIPDAATQALVMAVIYEQIKRGARGNPADFAKIDAHLRENGCDCGVLACTELSVYRRNHGTDSFYVDAMEVLVEQSILACGKQLRKE